VLVGGSGSDWLIGGGEGDVLIGGSAQLDADPDPDDDEDAAWTQVLGAWGGGDSYEDRVNAIAALLDDLDDGEADRLSGLSGRDVFFDGLGDDLTDVQTNGSNVEVVL
jgi:hypothetical protein